MYVSHMGSHRGQRRAPDPLEPEPSIVGSGNSTGTKLNSLEEYQKLLTAEPFLQPLILFWLHLYKHPCGVCACTYECMLGCVEGQVCMDVRTHGYIWRPVGLIE